MAVAQYTTPTFLLVLDDDNLDLTQAHNVYVTFKSKAFSLTKAGEDLEIAQKQIGVYLAQAETGRFSVGSVEIQANWTTQAGDRAASDVAVYEIGKQLLQKVVE